MANKRASEVAGDLAQHVGELVREELRVAGREMREKAARGRKGGVLIAAAGGLLLYAGGAALSGFVLMLSRVMPPWAAALVTSGVLTAVASALGAIGLGEARKALPLLPERAAEDAVSVAEAGTAVRPSP
ncbi:phage holin family protein [Amycolatopsis pigmentata]|uniref:Phage holin family protein n=1 Tax=Amycolatopsis pigmentata TaxID=450801 RepID=A0ABW5FXG8_9PSEU